MLRMYLRWAGASCRGGSTRSSGGEAGICPHCVMSSMLVTTPGTSWPSLPRRFDELAAEVEIDEKDLRRHRSPAGGRWSARTSPDLRASRIAGLDGVNRTSSQHQNKVRRSKFCRQADRAAALNACVSLSKYQRPAVRRRLGSDLLHGWRLISCRRPVLHRNVEAVLDGDLDDFATATRAEPRAGAG